MWSLAVWQEKNEEIEMIIFIKLDYVLKCSFHEIELKIK